jgi:hypothetical protein
MSFHIVSMPVLPSSSKRMHMARRTHVAEARMVASSAAMLLLYSKRAVESLHKREEPVPQEVLCRHGVE